MHELLERLGTLNQPEVEEDLVPEARIQQVQNRVLRAANVQIDLRLG